VKDYGEGIAPEQIERVFDRFYQGDQYAADEQGTGIGLALTKELVELHGGSIWADNNRGKGASFTVQLPFIPSVTANLTRRFIIESVDAPEDHPGELTSSSEMHAGQQNERPTILLVEDNKDLRHYIRMQLAEKYHVLESENGLQGIKKACETIPDLIISDWMMPELSGIELCERLKSDERTSHIPIILLTALATDDGKLKGLETGADDYLAKPFDNRELAIRVHNLIESRRKLRERFSRELYLEPANISVTSTDEKFLQKVLKIIEEHMGDCEFNTEEFSSEIGMSRMQLHRKLKALTGQGPGDFLRVMRLKRAAYLLEQQVGNVSEVAYQVGFNHLSHFTKSFREQFGMNPSDFIARKPVDLI
jgi:DNA-binding response OmpR family regulator